MPSDNDRISNSKTHPLIDTVVGQYRILSPIGRGGMGFVFKARHEIMNRDVAIKVLSPQVATDEIGIKRIRREATAMGSLQHPGIATIFDFGVTNEGQPFIVMELIGGKTLKDLLNLEKRLDPRRAVPILARIADAMSFAHDNGVVHRDLKPQNIMITDAVEKDFVKILDFGIAKSLNESVILTQKGEVLGSPIYMSPEQCTGKSIDQRSDIYALGAIMYEALTGRPPFVCSTIYETIYAKTTETPQAFQQTAPDLNDLLALEELTMSCLSISPYDRPSSMSEFKLRLASASDQLGIVTTSSLLPATPAPSISQTISTNAAHESTEPTINPTINPTIQTASEPQAQAPDRRESQTLPVDQATIKSDTIAHWKLSGNRAVLGLAAVAIIAILAGLGWMISNAFKPSSSPQQSADSRNSSDTLSRSPDKAGPKASPVDKNTVSIEKQNKTQSPEPTRSIPAQHPALGAMETHLLKKLDKDAPEAKTQMSARSPAKNSRSNHSQPRTKPSSSYSIQQTSSAPKLAPLIPTRAPTPVTPYQAPPVPAPKPAVKNIKPEDVAAINRQANRSYRHHKGKIQQFKEKGKRIWQDIKNIAR